MTLFFFILGLLFLVVGAECLIKGASRLAATFGVSALVIGLTVVAFGTSSPELAVSIKAALSDQADIALGNIIGSNIFNVLFILGVSAAIIPLVVSQQLIRIEVPLMIALSGLVLLFALDGRISRVDGLILVVGLMVYLGFSIYQSRKENLQAVKASDEDHPDNTRFQLLKSLFLTVIGLILLVIGSRWLVNGAVVFAQYLGVSELIIGLTIVAVGTSLPEVVTSVVAAIRGERDIAVGNVIGSNIFNIMGVLGLASLIAPTGIAVASTTIGFDIPIMIAAAFVCLPIFFTGGIISRSEGLLLLGFYVAYTLYLILAATQHDALPKFNLIMLYFVLPLTGITLLAVTLQEIRKRKRAKADG